MKKICFMLSIMAFVGDHIHAEIPPTIFKKYKQGNVLFCSGVYASVSFGTGIEAGFTKLYGIDRDKVLVDHVYKVVPEYLAYQRKTISEYKVFHGDPALELFDHIRFISERMLFVLSSCFPEPEGLVKNTVLEELDQIAQHHIKDHVIMVEYVQYAGTPRFGNVKLSDIKAKISSINQHYQFAFETGGHLLREANAVLVAYISR